MTNNAVYVIKRSGERVLFDREKIVNAVSRANEEVGEESRISEEDVALIADMVQGEVLAMDEEATVEQIQDMVEKAISSMGYADVAKTYILYRHHREKLRNAKSTLLNYKNVMDNYLNVNDWRVKENSTVTYSIGGLILSNSGAMTANYWLSEVYDDEIANAHRNGDLHIHDLSMLAPYCAGWSLKQLIQEGLGGVPSKITSSPAKHLSTLCNQMVNFLGIMQNEWAG